MKPPAMLLAAALLSVSACSPVGPDYEGPPEVEADARFANAAATQSAPVLDRWWGRLGDANLNRLIDATLSNNLDLRIARERLREARALRKQAGAALLPQATGNFSFTRIDFGRGGGGFTGEITETGVIDDPLDYWTAGADVSWEIDVFGGRRREARSAEARAQASQEALHATRLAIVSETVEACQTLAGLHEQLARVDAQVRGQQEQLADLEERQTAGAATSLEIDRARADLETTRAETPTLRSGIATQQRRLMVLLGSPRGAIDARIQRVRSLPAKLPMIRSGLPAELIVRRPDVRQAERELAAAVEDIGVAAANFYPRFSLLGNPSASTETFGDLFDAVSFDWQTGPSVSWSLFDGGRNKALLAAADARHRQALARYEKVVVEAIQEVESELSALRHETERLALVQRARQATAQSVARARQLRDAGALDNLDLLVEEQRLRLAEIAEVRVKSQLALVWTRFHKALGGGWE